MASWRSGGERLILRPEHWPEADRLAWARAAAAGDVLDGAGPAAGWPEETRGKRQRDYGRWLGFLQHTGRLDPDQGIGARVSRDNVAAYLRALEPRCASTTRWSYIMSLVLMLEVLDPEGDHAWLRELARRLHARMRPSIDRARQVLPAAELYAAGLTLMREALTMPQKPPARSPPSNRQFQPETTYRNGLMVAILAACPLRRRSFGGLELGRHLIRRSDGFWLQLEPRDLKNAASMTMPLPTTLTPWLDRYLEEIRPKLAQGYAGRRVWVSRTGKAMSCYSLNQRVQAVTERLLGRRVNMHLFRHCAATSMALEAPEHVREIPALLGHRDLATGERYYNLAQSSTAVRGYQERLLSLRRRLQEEESRLVRQSR